MRTVIIGAILLAMLGWAFYEVIITEEEAQEPDTNITGEEEAADEFQLQDESEEMAEPGEQGNWLQTEEEAPDFSLETLNGEEMSLSDYRGEKVMINFWATWCPPCRAEMPDMQEFYADHDVKILAVNLTQTEAGLSEVESFAEDLGITFPLLLDEEVKVANDYGIQPIPTSFFVDTKGVIKHINVGPMNYDMMVNELENMD
ncbi:peroxiredoxin family protein [Alteribacillus sp. JSM 102045]|uniref:peroxiredoxin family protein n=1 Tax=Alteribacillus sp. JSM 102045 TaxID=1562101 RepID=UPI0035C0A4E8